MLKPKNEVVVGLALASAFWVLLIALYSEPSAYAQICEYNQYTDKDHCTPHGPLFIVFTYVGYAINAITITAFATFFIALFTQQLRNATHAQLVHYRQVERAHVSMRAANAEFRRDDSGLIIGLLVSAVWKNSGTTPATPIVAMIGTNWVEKGEEFVFGQETDEGSIRQPFVLGPGAEQSSGTIEIAAEHILKNLAGSGQQFFWGWARYRDIFPDTPEHVVEFCVRIALTGKLGLAPVSPRISLLVETKHNRYYDERK